MKTIDLLRDTITGDFIKTGMELNFKKMDDESIVEKGVRSTSLLKQLFAPL